MQAMRCLLNHFDYAVNRVMTTETIKSKDLIILTSSVLLFRIDKLVPFVVYLVDKLLKMAGFMFNIDEWCFILVRFGQWADNEPESAKSVDTLKVS